MKIVFLDIDGVLNGSSWMGDGLPTITSMCVISLNRLLAETGAKIVVTSTWRDRVLNGQMNLAGFAYMLRTHGIAGEIEGITPSDGSVKGRRDQIRSWLSQNPRTTRFVILDDVDAGFTGMPFVKTNPKTGLTIADVDKAIGHLGRSGTGAKTVTEPIQQPRKLIIP